MFQGQWPQYVKEDELCKKKKIKTNFINQIIYD